jgi:hypothetical protein
VSSGGGSLSPVFSLVLSRCRSPALLGQFARADEEKGTLRILLTLLETQPHTTKTQQIESLHEAGLGRSGFYSSFNTLKEIDLITEETVMNREDRRVLLTSLSSMGNVVALDLRNLQLMLDRV